MNLGVPKQGGAFYSPWFGIETSDNLNLFQPVNPWLGSSWAAYIEYFQWQPENNINSPQGTVKPGDVIYGNVSLAADGKSYDSYHSSSNGWSVRMNVPIQKKGGVDKVYTIVYFVFEKAANCQQYPPEQKVTFTDIRSVQSAHERRACVRRRACGGRRAGVPPCHRARATVPPPPPPPPRSIEWEGVQQTPTWTTGIVDDVCNNRASIVDNSTVQITWNVNGENPPPELIAAHQKVGMQRPKVAA